MLRPATLQSASSSSSPVELAGHNESRRYGCPTSSHARRVPRRRRCRRRTMSDSTCCDETKPDSLQEVTASSQPEASAQLWTQVGANLRKIADEFYSSVGKVGTVDYHTFTRQSISPMILMQCILRFNNINENLYAWNIGNRCNMYVVPVFDRALFECFVLCLSRVLPSHCIIY